MWITNAGFSHVFIVFARIEDDKYISAFILDKSMKGIEIGEEEKKLGLRSSSTAMVFLEDVKCPVENLLGGRGKGFYIAMNALNTGRIKLATNAMSTMKSVTTLSVGYANERK